MHIGLQKNGKFKITKLELEHNHTLASPGKTHMLRSQRKLRKTQKSLIDGDDKSGLTPKQAFDFQATIAGGRENLGCLSMDVKNYLRTKWQKEMEKGDVASLMQYFHDKQLENKSFYYTFQVNNEEKITNIFWDDAKGIIDYSHFGDVVCFDTTYKINNYGRHVAPLLGINHHKQTIIFAVAILYDEISELFEWLFECFLMSC
jgi:zinc finger SWIM domain-containing protein 3